MPLAEGCEAEMVRQVSIQEVLDLLDSDQAWKRFQVTYPEARSGQFEIQKFRIDRNDPGRKRTILLEGMGRDPGSGSFHRIVEHTTHPETGKPYAKVWMSDTRSEIMEHTPILNKFFWCEPFAENVRVLVNGLGLGVVVHGALTYGNIGHIDVVESNPDVIALVAPYLPEDRVTIHLGDAYDISWPVGTRWDLIWHDIWPTISDENLPGMDQLLRKYKSRAGWQACWQRKGCLKMKRLIDQARAGTLDPQKALDFVYGRFQP
jgi:hypothetical protein